MPNEKHSERKLYSDIFGNITNHPTRTGLKMLLPDGGIIAKCCESILPNDKRSAEANAQRIVHCVNSHDALVAERDRLKESLEKHVEIVDGKIKNAGYARLMAMVTKQPNRHEVFEALEEYLKDIKASAQQALKQETTDAE